MAMTIEEVEALLTEIGFRFQRGPRAQVGMRFGMKQYLDRDGDKDLLVLVDLLENGEYLKVFAPMAFKATGDHADAFLRACSMVQWRTKLIQFEFDATDGEIRPIVEFPLEDGKVTRKQLERCIVGLAGIIDEYYPVLVRALKDGVVEFPPEGDPRAEMRLALQRLQASLDPADKERAKLVEALIASFDTRQAPSAGSPAITEV